MECLWRCLLQPSLGPSKEESPSWSGHSSSVEGPRTPVGGLLVCAVVQGATFPGVSGSFQHPPPLLSLWLGGDDPIPRVKSKGS